MITVDSAQFTLAIDKWVEKAKGRGRLFALEFIQDLNEAVIRATPVDTGFLRGSWYAQIGQSPAGTGILDREGAATVSRVNLVAATLKLGDVYYMTNGASYAVHVEYGTSRMAPRAFVRGTLAKANQYAEAAAARVAAMT